MAGIYGDNVTGTTNMQFNVSNPRIITSTIMNYTNRKVGAIGVRTDVLRLAFTNNSGIEQSVQSVNGADWTNVFTIGSGVEPTISTFSPESATNWNIVAKNSPVYNGESQICSIYGHVVLKETDGIQQDCVINLGIFVADKLVGETVLTPGSSSLMGVAIPDTSDPLNKSTTSITVNIVTAINTGESVTLKIRQTHTAAVPFTYYQANLFCRPIELTGTDKFLNPV